MGLRLLRAQGVFFADGSDRHFHAVIGFNTEVDRQAIRIDRTWPKFSADSQHVLYGARRNGKEVAVLDGVEGKEYDRVAGAVFKPAGGGFSFLARRSFMLQLPGFSDCRTSHRLWLFLPLELDGGASIGPQLVFVRQVKDFDFHGVGIHFGKRDAHLHRPSICIRVLVLENRLAVLSRPHT